MAPSMDEGQLVGCITINLSKAFDLLDIDILLCKLEHYGCNNKCIIWFKIYLFERQQS